MPSSSPYNSTGRAVNTEIDGNLSVKVCTGSDGNLSVAGTSTLTGAVSAPAGVTGPVTGVASGNLGAGVVGQSAITTTALTDIGPTFSVAGGLPAAGVSYQLYALLDLTAVGTATDVSHTIGVYWGGVAGTALATIVAENASTSLTGEAGFIEVLALVAFTSATAATVTISMKGPLGASGNGTAGYGLAAKAAVTGLSSSAAEVLTLGWTLSATTGSPSITPEISTVYRVA